MALDISSKPRKRLTALWTRKRLTALWTRKRLTALWPRKRLTAFWRLGSSVAALTCGLLLLYQSAKATSGEVAISITASGKTKTFSRNELLSHKQLTTLKIENDPAYDGRKTNYQAVPVAVLFETVKFRSDDTLLFKSLDGFSAPISAVRLLNTNETASVAYLAIEPAGQLWPKLKSGKTAGPFYLVWKNPSKSKISTEEWPFQLRGFEVKPSFEAQFPLTMPDSRLESSSNIVRGYKAFQRTCVACHQLNGQGASQLGPDLNLPLSPTEYLQKGIIERLVRDPQKLRLWPAAKMPALGVDSISDDDLLNVVEYLEHMSKRKPKTR